MTTIELPFRLCLNECPVDMRTGVGTSVKAGVLTEWKQQSELLNLESGIMNPKPRIKNLKSWIDHRESMIENLNPSVREIGVLVRGGGRKVIELEKTSQQSIGHAGHEFVKELIRHHSQDRPDVREDPEEAAASSSIVAGPTAGVEQPWPSLGASELFVRSPLAPKMPHSPVFSIAFFEAILCRVSVLLIQTSTHWRSLC